MPDLAAAREHAERIGYPLMVKATAGGGGRGIRRVERPEQLDEAFTRAASEAGRTLGDATVFLERADPRRPARRGAGDGRRARRRVDAGNPGLLGAAAEPEDPRGVRVHRAGRRAGAAAAGLGGRAGPGGRLRERRDRRVPLRAQGAAAHVPRGEHPAAGRAPGHRGDHRGGHRQAAAARGRRRPAGRPGRRAARPRAGTPSRPGSPPRTRSRASPRRPAGSSTWLLPAGPGIRVDTGVAVGDEIPPAVRLDDRQGDRLGTGPRRGAGPGCPGRCGRPRR